MLNRLISRRIVILLVLLFCAGCVHNLLSLGGIKETAPGLSPPKETVLSAPNPAVAPSSALSPEKRPRIVATAAGSDFSYHNEIVTEDVTWSGTVFVRGGLTIAPQATLTVDAGTVVTVIPDDEGSSGGSLFVQGRLAALGTAEKPVRFKPGTEKTAAGDWQGILILGSEKNNMLEQCRVEGAATGLDAVFSTVALKGTYFVSCGTGARLQGSLVRVTGGGASGCELGYSLVDSETDMREAVFSGNGGGLLLSGGALYMASSDFSSNTAMALESKGSKLMVLGSVFSGNGSGLSLSSSDGTLEANRMVDNLEYGVRLTRSRMRVSGNLISRNAGVGIMADDGDAAAWGNDITSNGRYDLYNAGREDFRAAGNWWGAQSVAQVKKRVFDKDDDPQRGSVLLQPLLPARPPLSP